MAHSAHPTCSSGRSEAAEKTCRKLGRRDRAAAFLIWQRTRRQASLVRIYDPEPTFIGGCVCFDFGWCVGSGWAFDKCVERTSSKDGFLDLINTVENSMSGSHITNFVLFLPAVLTFQCLVSWQNQAAAQDQVNEPLQFRKECDLGQAASCTELAIAYDHGSGVPQDYEKARILSKQACDGGNALGCTGLGWIFHEGHGVPQDYEKARILSKQACDGGEPLGCNNLGWIFHEGHGVPRDYEKARILSKQACDGGEPLGCNNLGVLYYYGHGVPQDYMRARILFEQACEAGEALGCSNIDTI